MEAIVFRWDSYRRAESLDSPIKRHYTRCLDIGLLAAEFDVSGEEVVSGVLMAIQELRDGRERWADRVRQWRLENPRLAARSDQMLEDEFVCKVFNHQLQERFERFARR